MKLLIDMNISPKWIQYLSINNIESKHWIDVGQQDAKDEVIMSYAIKNDYVVFTHDLDFGAMIALTKTSKPSIIQIRTQDIMPDAIGELVVSAIYQFKEILLKGAIIIIDEYKTRARILPLG